MHYKYLNGDTLFEDYTVRQAAAQFQRAINEISSTTTTGIPYIRALTRTLYDEGRKKEAEVVAKDFQEILNRIQKLSEVAWFLEWANGGQPILKLANLISERIKKKCNLPPLQNFTAFAPEINITPCRRACPQQADD